MIYSQDPINTLLSNSTLQQGQQKSIYESESQDTKVYKYSQQGKIFARKTIILNQQNKKRVRRQIKICKRLIGKQTKHIIKINKCEDQIYSATIKMDYYQQTLKDFIQQNWKKLASNPSLGLSIFLQILYAITELYQTHRDLKPSNIFVEDLGNDKVNIRLGDFGVSKCIKIQKKGSLVGTYPYIAPQIQKRLPYNSKSDIWSFGTIAYQLFNAKNLSKQIQNPNFQFPYNEMYNFNISNYYNEDIYQNEIIFHQRTPLIMQSLINKMLKVQPQQRISILQIYEQLFCKKNQIQILNIRQNEEQFMYNLDNMLKKIGQIQFQKSFYIKIKRFYKQIICFFSDRFNKSTGLWAKQLFYSFIFQINQKINILKSDYYWDEQDNLLQMIQSLQTFQQKIKNLLGQSIKKNKGYYKNLWKKHYYFNKEYLSSYYFLQSPRLISQIQLFC